MRCYQLRDASGTERSWPPLRRPHPRNRLSRRNITHGRRKLVAHCADSATSATTGSAYFSTMTEIHNDHQT